MPNMDNTLHEWVEQERIEKIGAEKERRAVVAWLREQGRMAGASPDEKRVLAWASKNIERGEHE